MGIWSRLLGRDAKKVGFSPEFDAYFGRSASKSGNSVTWDTALDVSTVLACVRAVADGAASLPLKVLKEAPGGKGSVPAPEHSLYDVLYRRPNEWQTAFSMRETMFFHLMLTGNAFFFKIVVRGRIKGLIPIEPGQVTVTRNADRTITYTVRGDDGKAQALSQDMVWHVRGPAWCDWIGLDITKRAREAIGLAMATESTQAELHANGLQMSGILSSEQKIDPTKYKQLQDWIAAQVGGPNKHKPLVIDSGLKWADTTMTGVDAQHLETRKMQIEEICRVFKVFPQMVGHSDKTSTFASAEAFFEAHIRHTLGPWCTRIENSINCDLLSEKDYEDGYFVKFNFNGMQRTSFAERFEGYAKALGSGGHSPWMTVDEIRALEDLNPQGGDSAVLPKPVSVVKPTGDKQPPKENQE